MSWKADAKSLIFHYQGLDKYAKYADLGEFLQWADSEGHRVITKHIRATDTNRNWCAKELIRWRKDHVSPWILFTFARDFAASGTGVLNQHLSNGSKPPGIVVYFLYGRGIELYLKAFLVARGNTAGDVRESYGHDLAQLLKEARRRKLGRFVPLNDSEVRAVQILNVSYSDKQYEYPVLGGQVRPSHVIVKKVVSKMETGLQNFCRKVTAEKWTR